MGYRYCPVCAIITIDQYRIKCNYCDSEITNTKHEEEYYLEKAKELYKYNSSNDIFCSTDGDIRKALFDLEVSKNPLFDKQLYETRIAEKKAQDDAEFKQRVAKMKAEQRFTSTPNVPTCPTCHSTNVKKISLAKGYLHWRMFGFFSKTARSQWECLNCSHKW